VGHWPQLDVPGKVARLVRGFVQEHALLPDAVCC